MIPQIHPHLLPLRKVSASRNRATGPSLRADAPELGKGAVALDRGLVDALRFVERVGTLFRGEAAFQGKFVD